MRRNWKTLYSSPMESKESNINQILYKKIHKDCKYQDNNLIRSLNQSETKEFNKL